MQIRSHRVHVCKKFRWVDPTGSGLHNGWDDWQLLVHFSMDPCLLLPSVLWLTCITYYSFPLTSVFSIQYCRELANSLEKRNLLCPLPASHSVINITPVTVWPIISKCVGTDAINKKPYRFWKNRQKLFLLKINCLGQYMFSRSYKPEGCIYGRLTNPFEECFSLLVDCTLVMNSQNLYETLWQGFRRLS